MTKIAGGTGDMIELDVDARRLHLDVTEELARRRAARQAPKRGSCRLYVKHVLQADPGADLDSWWAPAAAVPRDSH